MAIAAATAHLLLGGATPIGSLDIDLTGLRSTRGVIQLCVTADPAHFPDCSKADALKRTVPASARTVRLEGLAPGSYAVSLFHDENQNGRLDTLFGIPREGFGFSRNPVVRFGPPRFDAARFEMTAPTTEQAIRLRYLL